MVEVSSGGGGSGDSTTLTFEVVGGTTPPSDPGESTIWVNTSEEITGWVFSAKEPQSPAEGLVWFTTWLDSPTAFDAIDANGIWVYPVAGSQYTDGAWVPKAVSTYTAGAWAEWWQGELYDAGNEFTAVTGGWEIGNIPTEGYSSTNPATLTKNADNMVFTAGRNTVWTVNKVDMSRFNTLTWSGTTTGYSFVQVADVKAKGFTAVASKSMNNGATSCEVDISSLSGEYYVVLVILANATVLTTEKIRME